jgi:hypothetical protein
MRMQPCLSPGSLAQTPDRRAGVNRRIEGHPGEIHRPLRRRPATGAAGRRNRATDGEILLARSTEDDNLAGKLVDPKSKLKRLISRPLGIMKSPR